MEIWKDIKGYEGLYQVSNFGRVKRLENKRCDGHHVLKEKILKNEIKKTKYVYIHLCKDGKVKGFRVHRLVAEAFIDNPNNLPQVNHINCDKTDNRVDNLEWCTASENQKHCVENRLRIMKKGKGCTSSKPVIQYDLQGNLIKEYECIRQASDELKIHTSDISRVCKGIYKQTHKYIFKYKDIV